MNMDIAGASAGGVAAMAQSMKLAYKSSSNIFGGQTIVDQNASLAGDGDEEKGKTARVRIPFYQLNQEERIQLFRIKSAKKDKKREEDLK